MAKNRLDLKTRLKRWGENHAADRSNSAGSQESSSEPLEELSYPILATAKLTGQVGDGCGQPAE